MTSQGVPEAAFEECVNIWSLPAGDAQAGGDWCEVFEISEELVALTVGDIAGHGKAVAVTMAAIHARVMRAIQHMRDPAAVLSVANEFAFNYGEGVIVTAIVAFLNRRLHTLTFANAGHPPPLILAGDCHAFLEHPPADLPLGIYSQYNAANYVIALPLDALLVLYTDGITEHGRDPVRGEQDLAEAARLVYDRPEFDDARAIAREIFHNGSGHDDAALMVVRAARAEM
jgi:serine phosphatase RsbU (regulator of sigma subunit)